MVLAALEEGLVVGVIGGGGGGVGVLGDVQLFGRHEVRVQETKDLYHGVGDI